MLKKTLKVGMKRKKTTEVFSGQWNNLLILDNTAFRDGPVVGEWCGGQEVSATAPWPGGPGGLSSTRFFLYKNPVYKNVEAQIS